MFRPTKQTDVKFPRHITGTPFLMSPLDGGIDHSTRSRGERILFKSGGSDTNQRYLMPLSLYDIEPEIEEVE